MTIENHLLTTEEYIEYLLGWSKLSDMSYLASCYDLLIRRLAHGESVEYIANNIDKIIILLDKHMKQSENNLEVSDEEKSDYIRSAHGNATEFMFKILFSMWCDHHNIRNLKFLGIRNNYTNQKIFNMESALSGGIGLVDVDFIVAKMDGSRLVGIMYINIKHSLNDRATGAGVHLATFKKHIPNAYVGLYLANSSRMVRDGDPFAFGDPGSTTICHGRFTSETKSKPAGFIQVSHLFNNIETFLDERKLTETDLQTLHDTFIPQKTYDIITNAM